MGIPTPVKETSLVLRKDLQAILGVSSETIRRWLKTGKLPEPDIKLSHRTSGWNASTLKSAGVDLWK